MSKNRYINEHFLHARGDAFLITEYYDKLYIALYYIERILHLKFMKSVVMIHKFYAAIYTVGFY